MIRVVICDDNNEDSLKTEVCARNLFESKNLKFKITVIDDETKLLEACGNVDFLFLDIELRRLNGISIGKQLRASKNNCHIIITSHYQKYLLDGYVIKPDRYLLKPYSQIQFNQMMEPIINEYLAENRYIVDEKIPGIKLYVQEILYLEYERKHTYIYLNHKKIKTPYSLSYWIDTLKNECFSQCYKSIIVNVKKIKSLDKQDVYLENDVKLPVSRHYKKQFEKDWINEMRKSI